LRATGAALAAIALIACKGAQPRTAPEPAAPASTAGAAEPAVYYPLAVGNSWTYQVTDPSGVHEETIRIVGRDGPWFLDDHRGRLQADSAGVRDADRYLLRTPLTPGAKWTAVENLVVQRFEVIATDAEVTTRAGRFGRCVVVRNEQPIADKRGKYVTEWTYAPHVGLAQLVTQTVSASGTAHDQVRLELVSYRVH
jgi:hypothetical protein